MHHEESCRISLALSPCRLGRRVGMRGGRNLGRAFPIADQQRRVVSTHDGASPEPSRAPSGAFARAFARAFRRSLARMNSASRSAGPRASGFPVHLGPALTPPRPRSPPLQVVLAASVVTKGGKGAPRHPNPTRAAPRVPPAPALRRATRAKSIPKNERRS